MDTTSVLGHRYLPRTVDGELGHRLQVAGAVVVEGPRACGKTMTGLHAAESCVFLDDPSSVALAQQVPSALLAGARPRLLDEWQLAPELWNLVRREVDRASQRGQFILTGSAVPADDVTRHRSRSFPPSADAHHVLAGACDSTGSVSLRGLLEGDHPQPSWESTELPQLVDCLLRSGFPALRDLGAEDSALAMTGYLEDVTRTDVHRLAQVRHAPEVLDHMVRSLARQTAAQVRVSTLAADLEPVAPGVRAETVASYLELLERLFVVERVPAWTPSLRSRARLRTTSRLHLADPRSRRPHWAPPLPPCSQTCAPQAFFLRAPWSTTCRSTPPAWEGTCTTTRTPADARSTPSSPWTTVPSPAPCQPWAVGPAVRAAWEGGGSLVGRGWPHRG